MRTIAFANQKGGTGKTTSAVNIGVALAQEGYKVLLVDFDPQGNLSHNLGTDFPHELSDTICTLLMKTIQEIPIEADECLLHSEDGVDYIPSKQELGAIQMILPEVQGREALLKRVLEPYEDRYDYCLIDTGPELGLLLVNALTAADEVIIPVQSSYFAIQGMGQLVDNIKRIRQSSNPELKLAGIIMTLTDHTNASKEVCAKVREEYGQIFHVFDCNIPRNTRTLESGGYGHSVIVYEPSCVGAKAYRALTKEVIELGIEKQVPYRAENALTR